MDSALMQKIESHAFRNSIPIYVTIELTLRCNLRCVHCYNFDRALPLPKEIRRNELTGAEVRRLLDELAEAGTLMVSFSGGEALAHPELIEYVEYAKNRNLGVKIKSNATLLTPALGRRLVEAGATDMDISLYGAKAETHDSFTTVRGSFEKTWRGIRVAREAGLHPNVNFILHRGCVGELQEMAAQCEELGVRYSFSTELTARYDGSTSSHDHRLTESDLRAMLQGPMGHLFSDYKNDSDNVQCSCARSVCGVSSVGEVYPCIGAPIPSGNLREKGFLEIWRTSEQLNRIRALSLDDFKSCKPCPDRKYCQRSSGSAFVDTGEYTGPDPFACTQARVLREFDAERSGRAAE